MRDRFSNLMHGNSTSSHTNLVEGETTVKNATINREHGRMPRDVQIPISAYFAVKHWPVRAIGMLMLVIASPLILLLIVLVRSTSSGPGLFRQIRSGQNGTQFTMYKIRTMYQNAEAVTGPTWCTKGDSRVTPIGKILRLLHLDELPQLINVVRGEMDLIGPRPERPVFVTWLSRELPHYTDRLRILPGVTGLAQINLPPDESIESVSKKLVLDRQYIMEASFSLDFRILMCTFLRMVGIRHGLAARWLGLARHVGAMSESCYGPSANASVMSEGAQVASDAANFDEDRYCPALVPAGAEVVDAPRSSDLPSRPELAGLSSRRPR